MKKRLYLFFAGSSLLLNAFGQPGLPAPAIALDGYTLVRATNSLVKFNLDFAGGMPGDLVKAVERASDKPLNVVIPDDCANLTMPPFSVKNVTVPELFEVLMQASKKAERFTVLDPRDRSIGGNGSDVYTWDSSYGFSTVGVPSDDSIWYFRWDRGREHEPWQVLSSTVCRFYQLRPYLDAGYKVEDVRTAVDTAWKMLDLTNTPAMSYHKDTGVLIVVGKQEQVDLVSDVLKQLPTAPKEKAGGNALLQTQGR